MKRMEFVVLALVAAFASSLALTAVASAANGNPKAIECEKKAGGKFTDGACTKEGAEGTFERKFIGAGESREVLAEASSVLKFKGFVGNPLACKKLKLKPGANLKGAEGTSASTGEGTVEYSECEVEKSPNCKINGSKAGEGKITTKNLMGKLAFETKADAENSEKELVKTVSVSEPADKKAFAKFILEGEGCSVKGETEVKGSIISKNPDGNEHKTTHVGEAVEKPPTAYFENVGGAAKEVKPAKLEAFGGKAEVTGKTLGSLPGGGIPSWTLVIIGI